VKRSRQLDGKKVQRLREDLEEMPTQEMMAQATGLTRQTVSDIERNKRPNANRSTIFALAKYLGVKPSDLLADAPSNGPGSSAGEVHNDQPTFRAG
jgi:DNA-binding XRE family transcriptional regulator